MHLLLPSHLMDICFVLFHSCFRKNWRNSRFQLYKKRYIFPAFYRKKFEEKKKIFFEFFETFFLSISIFLGWYDDVSNEWMKIIMSQEHLSKQKSNMEKIFAMKHEEHWKKYAKVKQINMPESPFENETWKKIHKKQSLKNLYSKVKLERKTCDMWFFLYHIQETRSPTPIGKVGQATTDRCYLNDKRYLFSDTNAGRIKKASIDSCLARNLVYRRRRRRTRSLITSTYIFHYFSNAFYFFRCEE